MCVDNLIYLMVYVAAGDPVQGCLSSFATRYDNGDANPSGSLSASYKKYKSEKYNLFASKTSDDEDPDFDEMVSFKYIPLSLRGQLCK